MRWTGSEATALRVACAEVLHETTEDFAQNRLGIATRTVYYWAKHPERVVKPEVQAILATALEQAPADVRTRFEQLRRDAHLPTPAGAQWEDAGVLVPASPAPDAGEVFDIAANESVRDVLLQSSSVSDALPGLHEQVKAVAVGYDNRTALSAFNDAKGVRGIAKELAARTQRPNECADLFVIMGQTTAMMASVGFDMGYWSAASKLASAATAYAEMADHSGLVAWTYGLRGTLEFWNQNPTQALEHIAKGLAMTASPAAQFRLNHIAARAHAVAGNRDGVMASIAAAESLVDAMSSTTDPLHDELGGEFAFGHYRAAACAAAAGLALGDGELVEQYASQVLDQLTNERSQSAGRGPVLGTRIDLATARLLQSDTTGARQHLSPILALAPDLRTVSLASRMRTARQVLDGLKRPDAELVEGVDAWLSSTTQSGHADGISADS